MKNSIPELRPKANKLLDFVRNWQLAKPDLNIELGAAIESIINKESTSFPLPIQTFFELPYFKEILINMREGKFYKKPEKESEEIEFHPPLEIQNIQLLVEAFCQLLHLDYNKEPIKDPLVQGKILGENILSYLSCIDLFSAYDGVSVETILSYLFQSIQDFSLQLKNLILFHSELFSLELIKIIDEKIFKDLFILDRATYQHHLVQDWYPVLIELNLDPKLGSGIKKLKAIATANSHKLVNQIQSVLGEKRQFYQRNLPLYRPFDVKKQVLEKLEEFDSSSTVQGQRINELFYTQFWKEKYPIIEAKQSGTNKKFKSFAHQIWPIKESLYALITQYGLFLPKKFSSFFIDTIHPLSVRSTILGKPNALAVQFVLGFYNSQYDFLAELLSESPTIIVEPKTQEKLYALIPAIFSFLENYYLKSPKPSFSVIRHKLENLFSGQEAMQEFSITEAKNRIEETFTLLLPNELNDIELLEAAMHKILSDLTSILQDLRPNSIEYLLLQQRIIALSMIDLPSYPEGWFAFGGILGVYFILLSETDSSFSEKLTSFEELFSKHPFIQMLFYSSDF
jgi:hypothetical protein